MEELRRKRAEREAQELNEAQELAGKLGKLKLVFTLETGGGEGQQEKSFGSVTSKDIADKLKEQGYEVDRKKIDLPKAIKDLGEHEVIVKLGSDIQAKLNVVVNRPFPRKRKRRGHRRQGAKKAKPKKAPVAP